MPKIFSRMILEVLIVLVIWMGGWGLFWGGSWGLKVLKEQYWSQEISRNPAYKTLSVSEKELARAQFMKPGSIRFGDEPFRHGRWTIYLAYGAAFLGSWLKDFWLLIYALVTCIRLRMHLKRSSRAVKTSGMSLAKELRIIYLFLWAALVWYVCWQVLIPLTYVAWHRFYMKSFDYLWNARLIDFEHLAQGWPYLLILYPVSALVRGWRQIFFAGKSR